MASIEACRAIGRTVILGNEDRSTERIPQNCSSCDALSRIFLQALLDQRADRRGRCGLKQRPRRFAFDDVRKDLGDVLSVKRAMACE
jgi:hypothetical protein